MSSPEQIPGSHRAFCLVSVVSKREGICETGGAGDGDTPRGLADIVVASSRTGAMNAMYEGIRCASGEYKTYARHNANGGWNLVSQPTWQSLYAPASASRHTLMVARGGICRGNAPNDTVEQMMRDLRSPPDQKYELPRR